MKGILENVRVISAMMSGPYNYRRPFHGTSVFVCCMLGLVRKKLLSQF